MAIITARDLVTESLRTSNAVGLRDTPDSNEITNALNKLNLMLESWDLESLWPYTKKEVKGNFVPNQDTYTIGEQPGDDIQIPRIDRITGFGYVISQNVYNPLTPLSMTDWANAYRVETVTGLPSYYIHYSDFPSARVVVYPKPVNTYEFTLQYDVKITQYELNDVIELPSGYRPAIVYGLAVLLAKDYGVNYQTIQEDAIRFKAVVKRLNTQSRDLSLSKRYGGGRADIRSDSIRGQL